MTHIECEHCKNPLVPLNDSITVDGKVYCSSCFDSTFSEESSLEGKDIKKELDPTICNSCQKDGNDILKKIGRYPMCENCERTIRKRAFPLWVKAFLVGIAGIVIFSFFWNWKYYHAYSELEESRVSFENADYANAREHMLSASDDVPEIAELKSLAEYYNGIKLIQDDRSAEALAAFNNCKSGLPESFKLDYLVAEASGGAAFDRKDYSGFLKASKESLAIDSTTAESWAKVASAYACVYAENGQDSAKALSLKFLNRAKTIDSSSASAKEYGNRIEHRLASRQIIKQGEFIKQYPNGWTKK